MLRHSLIIGLLLFAPAVSHATPLTADDLTFVRGLSIGDWGTLELASTNGSSLTAAPYGNGSRIVFDTPFTGTWSFQYKNIELWPIAVNCEPCFGMVSFFLPLAAPGLPETFVPFVSKSIVLESVSILNFAVPGAGTSTLTLRDMVFSPVEGPTELASETIPEPGTVALLGGGLALAAARRWRRGGLTTS